MKQFNLDEYLANPSRKMVTRCGYSVRILCTDKKASLPIVALITDKNGEEFVGNYNSFGKYNDSNYACSFDLFFAPEEHEGWINVYRDTDTGTTSFGVVLYASLKEAEGVGKSDDYYVATAKIEWEE